MWLCSKRPVNVQITFTGRFVIGCLLGVWMIEMDVGLFDLICLVVFDDDGVEILYW